MHAAMMEESRSFMPRFAGPALRNPTSLCATRVCYSSILVRGRKIVVGVADFLFFRLRYKQGVWGFRGMVGRSPI